MIDERLLHAHNASEFWRSVRDFVWYAGQVVLMWLAWSDRARPVYLVVAGVAALIAVSTAIAAVKWRRELRRDRERRAEAAAGGAEARLRHAR
jgi:hypothetical protein